MWVFVGQMIFVAAGLLCALRNILPSRFCQAVLLWSLFLSPLVYLAVLAKPIKHIGWREPLRDAWALTASILRTFGRLFLPSTFMKLVRFVASLKPLPTTVDGWITLGVLPFKTCIAATFPVIWIFEKVLVNNAYFHPYGRVFGLSYDRIFQFYLISLIALFFGSVLQGIFCRAGRATVTLRFFLVGFVVLFFVALMPRI